MLEVATPTKLESECRTFTRYLAGGDPTPALLRAYAEGHASIPFLNLPEGQGISSLDRAMLRLARVSPHATRTADAYARFFRPGGALRQKLTLLLAILEHAPPYHSSLNSGSGVGPARAFLAMVWIGVSFMAALFVGIFLLSPVHLVARFRDRGPDPAPIRARPGAGGEDG